MSIAFGFQHSYATTLTGFYARVQPTPVAAPRLVRFNTRLAEQLGLDAAALQSEAGAAILAGNQLPSDADPIALAYAGHQFGSFVPQLGDGRAILLGEVIGQDGVRRDVQLKGAGRTPFSRRGDGRAALGPVLREYLVSEAMHALGIPTTRALAAVATGEPVYRETILPGAVFTRIAASHIRVGTFQFFSRQGGPSAVQRLADYVMARHYPACADSPTRYLDLLDAVMARQIDLVVRWMMVGFIHGVMNTDNMAISGETLDFGPCAFMDAYDPGTVFSSIDEGGRYAYANQAPIAQWNLARLAETLLPLIDPDAQRAVHIATEHLVAFDTLFENRWLAGMRKKLGLERAQDGDDALIQDLLEQLQQSQADFTTTFRALCQVAGGGESASLSARFRDPARLAGWLSRWQDRCAQEPASPVERAHAMRQINPAFIPRNHRVEDALQKAVVGGDLTAFDTLATVLARPYDDQPQHADLAQPPPDSFGPYRTFCGT